MGNIWGKVEKDIYVNTQKIVEKHFSKYAKTKIRDIALLPR